MPRLNPRTFRQTIIIVVILALTLMGAPRESHASQPRLLEGYTTILPQGFPEIPVAGTLVRMERTGDVTPLGSLAQCGVDPALLSVTYTPVDIPKTIEHRGFLARLGTTKLFGLQIAPMDTLEVVFENAQFETITSLMALVDSVVQDPAPLVEKCSRWIFEPHVYWVDRALRTDRLTVREHKEVEASVGAAVKGQKRARTAVLAGVSADSSKRTYLEIRDLRYVALRLRHPSKLITGQLAREGTQAGLN